MIFLSVLAVFVLVLILVLAALSVKYNQDSRVQLSPSDESQYEIDPSVIVTAGNVDKIVEWQILKAQGLVTKDHPAIAARKAVFVPVKN